MKEPTMDDRMKVIREALDRALTLIGAMMSYDNYGAYPHDLTERVNEFIAPFDKHGIAALDSLAVEPSEDARELAKKIIDAEKYDQGFNINGIAALITTRDERIKAEERKACVGRLLEKLGISEDGYIIDRCKRIEAKDLIAAIMRTEVEG